MRRWHGPRYLTDPEIQNLFVGTYRNGDNSRYFRIGPDGKHQKYAVKRAAAKLGLGHETLSRLLQEAQASGLILVGKFDNGERKPIPPIKKEKLGKDMTRWRSYKNSSGRKEKNHFLSAPKR